MKNIEPAYNTVLGLCATGFKFYFKCKKIKERIYNDELIIEFYKGYDYIEAFSEVYGKTDRYFMEFL